MTDSEKLKICVEALEHVQMKERNDGNMYPIVDEALLKISQPKEQGEPRWPLDVNHKVYKNGKLVANCDTSITTKKENMIWDF